MLHCAASLKSMEAGIPSICLDGGMRLEWLQSGAITDDMRQIAVRKHYVGRNVFGADAKLCRVTSRYGTDFTYRVDDDGVLERESQSFEVELRAPALA